MADKDSTLIIEVDLACETCCTKIQKVLCKIKAKENIKSISYDTKKNEVTISGSFNPNQLYCKLRCKARCCIKGRRIPKDEKKDEKKEEKKKEDEKKKEEKKEEKEKPVATAEANTMVNLQFTQVCFICYPWPCKDPISHCQPRHCEGGMVQAVNHHQHPPMCGVPPKCNTCAGPPRCGGCGSCEGGGSGGCGSCRGCSSCGGGGCGGCGSCGDGGCGWSPPTPKPPICCPGPSCRGCMGCRLVHEQKYEYHEYPPSAWCIIM